MSASLPIVNSALDLKGYKGEASTEAGVCGGVQAPAVLGDKGSNCATGKADQSSIQAGTSGFFGLNACHLKAEVDRIRGWNGRESLSKTGRSEQQNDEQQ
jgi:hypothetical protein